MTRKKLPEGTNNLACKNNIIKVLCIIICLTSIVTLAGCGSNDDDTLKEHSLMAGITRSDSVKSYDFSDTVTQPSKYETFSASVTDFTVSLLKSSAVEGENNIISPLSLYSSLTILQNGTGSQTQREFKKLLGSEMSFDEINICSHYLRERLMAFNSDGENEEDEKEKGVVNVFNALFMNEGYDLNRTFLQKTYNYYDLNAYQLDLSSSTAKDEINNWISTHTNGEIKELLEDTNKEMFLVNTTFLEAQWLNAFDKGLSKNAAFHTANGDIETNFMVSNEYYIKSSKARGFIKNLDTIPCRFAAILPNEDIELGEYISKLNVTELNDLLSLENRPESVYVSMPSFSVSQQLDFSDTLKSMGFESMFSSSADFGNLVKSGNGLFVDSVFQKSTVDVNESGVRAAAATVTDFETSAPAFDENAVILDRPFLFVIFENESNIPIFIGTVNNPSE